MIPMLLALALTLARAQGQTSGVVSFANAGTINAPFYDADGITRLAGSQFRAALFWGPGDSPPEGMMQVGQYTTFLTGANAGFWLGGNRTITPLPSPDMRVSLQVRFWDSVDGTIGSFEVAQAAGAKIGVSQRIILVLNSNLQATPMTGLQSAGLVLPTITLTRGAGLVMDSGTIANGTSLTSICNVPVGLNRWFRLTSPYPGEALVSTMGSSFDTVMGAYTGSIISPSMLTMVTCNDDRLAGGTASQFRLMVQANTLYLLCVAGKNGASGTIQLNHTLLTRLGIRPTESGIELSWPADASNFVAEVTSELPADWRAITNTPVTVGNRKVVERDCPEPHELYRLRLNSP